MLHRHLHNDLGLCHNAFLLLALELIPRVNSPYILLHLFLVLLDHLLLLIIPVAHFHQATDRCYKTDTTTECEKVRKHVVQEQENSHGRALIGVVVGVGVLAVVVPVAGAGVLTGVDR